MNKYLEGTIALAARHAAPRADVVGYNWWQVLYSPASLAYDYANNPASAPNQFAGASANQYWGKQRAMVSPLAQGTTARTQAAQQVQAQLRAQQAANIAAMQAQLAATAPSSYVPSSPSPFMDAGLAPSPSSGDGASDEGAPFDTSVIGAALPDQFLLIKVKNVGDLVKAQGGALGNFAFSLAPQTIANTVYSTMQKQFAQKLKEQGVDADVTVTANPPQGSPPKAEFLRGAAIGIGAVGVGWAAWHYGLSRLFKKRSR